MVVAVWRGERKEIIPVSEIGLPGMHNCENIMAAVAAVLPLNPDVKSLGPVIKRKDGVPHRMEFVREICGVTFYNDSKATNVASVVKVLSGLDKPVILIAGGRAKEKDFSSLKKVVGDHCRSVVLMGESAQLIAENIGESVPKSFVQNMNEAVQTAQRAAEPGDIVLLAPACASFDMFRDFEERGESFKTEVGNLKKTNCPEMVKR
jgi:UDP-N-acetylmuramoylalanine--D-glutamate ligase